MGLGLGGLITSKMKTEALRYLLEVFIYDLYL